MAIGTAYPVKMSSYEFDMATWLSDTCIVYPVGSHDGPTWESGLMLATSLGVEDLKAKVPAFAAAQVENANAILLRRPGSIHSVQASGDSSTLLCSVQADPFYWLVSQAKTTRPLEMSPVYKYDFYQPIWRPDGHSWFASRVGGNLADGTRFYLCDVKTGCTAVDTQISPPETLLGCDHDNRLVLLSSNIPAHLEVGLSHISIDSKDPPAPPITIRFPADYPDLRNASLSPDGSRIAWLLEGVRDARGHVPDYDHVPTGWKTHTIDSLIAVSNADGSDMHPVARQPISLDEWSKTGGLRTILWTPGGRKLALYRGQSIVLLPVSKQE
jgi:hypothetical protein